MRWRLLDPSVLPWFCAPFTIFSSNHIMAKCELPRHLSNGFVPCCKSRLLLALFLLLLFNPSSHALVLSLLPLLSEVLICFLEASYTDIGFVILFYHPPSYIVPSQSYAVPDQIRPLPIPFSFGHKIWLRLWPMCPNLNAFASKFISEMSILILYFIFYGSIGRLGMITDLITNPCPFNQLFLKQKLCKKVNITLMMLNMKLSLRALTCPVLKGKISFLFLLCVVAGLGIYIEILAIMNNGGYKCWLKPTLLIRQSMLKL